MTVCTFPWVNPFSIIFSIFVLIWNRHAGIVQLVTCCFLLNFDKRKPISNFLIFIYQRVIIVLTIEASICLIILDHLLCNYFCGINVVDITDVRFGCHEIKKYQYERGSFCVRKSMMLYITKGFSYDILVAFWLELCRKMTLFKQVKIERWVRIILHNNSTYEKIHSFWKK